MRCGICDHEDNAILYDKVTKEFTPCSVCSEIIDEALSEFEEDRDEIEEI